MIHVLFGTDNMESSTPQESSSENLYERERREKAQKLREFCDLYFGEQGGYAQQYLFHHARMNRQGR